MFLSEWCMVKISRFPFVSLRASAHRNDKLMRQNDKLIICLALLFAVTLQALCACVDGGRPRDGLAPTPTGDGPVIVFDPIAEPTPEIPFPNDLVTVHDSSSPTGRRLNVRTFAPTVFEQSVRTHLDELDGFGTFAPITVSFDRPIRPETVTARTVRVINMNPSSPNFGRPVLLDLNRNDSGRNFPIQINPMDFPPHDAFNAAGQLLLNPELGDIGDPDFCPFYERETDTLIIRVVEPLEQQSEYAVVLTRGITGADGEPIRSPFPSVNHAAQTKRLRPIEPILSGLGTPLSEVAFAWAFTTQSVTRDMEAIARGMSGEGPFAYLAEAFPPVLGDIESMETQIDALFCDDPLTCRDNICIIQASFFDTFLKLIMNPEVSPLIVDLVSRLLDVKLGENEVMELSMPNIDYIVFGTFTSPDFRATSDGVWDVNYRTGEATVGSTEVPFLISIPRATEAHRPPFPVILHAHGNPSINLEVLAYADSWARHGYACACIDAVQHGPLVTIRDIEVILASLFVDLEEGLCGPFPGDLCEQILEWAMAEPGSKIVQLIRCVLFGDCGSEEMAFHEALEELLSTGLFKVLVSDGRAEDLDGDGNPDHGVFFTADLFESRDKIRQTAVDQIQFLRILRNLLHEAVPPPVLFPGMATKEELLPNLLAGDFNADGILDLGGVYRYSYDALGFPRWVTGYQDYYRSGFSMGSMVNSILAAVEPEVDAYTLLAAGGGLSSDIILRCDMRSVVNRVFHETLGPVLVGEPDPDGRGPGKVFFIVRKKRTYMDLGDPGMTLWDNEVPVPVGEAELVPGGRVIAVNLDNGEVEERTINDDGTFSVGIPADAGDAIHIRIEAPSGAVTARLEAEAPTRGFGLRRNSPDFRRFVGLGQITLEKGDPINYAPHWFLDPLPAMLPKNILQLAVPGDTFVPINTQMALARSGGLFGSDSNVCDGEPASLDLCGSDEQIRADCDCINMKLTAERVMLGFHNPEIAEPRYDIDDLADDNDLIPGMSPPIGPLPPVRTGAGLAAVRFPYSSFDSCEAYDESGCCLEYVNKGKHWFMLMSDTAQPIDWAIYAQNQAATYFNEGGRLEADELDCPRPVTGETCGYLPPFEGE